MKITTTIEVTEQEKTVMFNALEVYRKYLTDLKGVRGDAYFKLKETLEITNQMLNEVERNI